MLLPDWEINLKLSVRKIRMSYRMIYETACDIWRGGWSNWIVISILTSVLVIFGFVLQVSFGLNVISQKLTDQMEFSIYLSDETDPKGVALKIGKLPYIKKVEVIEKDIAWYEFKKNYVVSDDFQNPLPNTIHVRVARIDYLKPTIIAVKKLEGVTDINYAPGILGFINKLRHFLQVIGIGISILLAFVTIVITANTIHLVINSRQSEIEILRLMGVENWYIRGPLILQGIFYAVVASTVAIVPLLLLQAVFWETAQNIIGGVLPTGLPYQFRTNIFQVYNVLLLVGILVSCSGCIWSSNKYLKV